MSFGNQIIADYLAPIENNINPSKFFHGFKFFDDEYSNFSSIFPPNSKQKDYFKVIDSDNIVVITFDTYFSTWTYSIFHSMESYIECILNEGPAPEIFDYGFSSFDSCFKAAIVDMLQMSRR